MDTSAPKPLRRVLLVDPVFLNHSLLYYRAALASTGFEECQFTIATCATDSTDRQRVADLCQSDPRVTLRLLEHDPGPLRTRWECWRGFGRSLRLVERLLRVESFDLVAYLLIDMVLPYFAFPFFRPGLRGHFQARVAGTVFRDHGLRPPLTASAKARLRAGMDRWILRRAIAGGGLRKLAFLDPRCAEAARTLFQTDLCGYGVDPIELQPCDATAARQRFGLAPEDFVFLFFGSLSDRKGVVESLARLRDASLPGHRTVVILAGPVNPSLRPALTEAVAATARQYRVIQHDRFIDHAEVPPYFAAADCVVCVYKDFAGSSNVLLHAAACGKPALVSRGGVMQDAVEQYGFGAAVSFADPEGFARSARRWMDLEAGARQALAGRARTYAATMDARRYLAQFL